MLSNIASKRVVVFIDASNIYFAQKSLGWQLDFLKLHQYLKNEVSLQKIYFYSAINPDNEKERKFHDFLDIIGYTVRHKKVKFIKEDTSKGGHHKGNVDVELTIDAVDRKDEYDTCILFSGDGDFEVLLKYLKRHKKRCIVISTKGHISIELIRQAKFIDLKKLKTHIMR